MDSNRYTLHPSHVLGFHSCDKELALDVLNGRKSLRASRNAWDWLGHGIYFWEQNPLRALEYAKSIAAGDQKSQRKIKTPFVLGGIIDLGKCLNLIEPSRFSLIREAFNSLDATLKADNQELPKNRGKARVLDCAVFMHLHNLLKQKGDFPYDTVRGAFPEGEPIYDGCAISDQTHIQICVRDPKAVLGYFLPFPIEEVNPYL